LNKQELLHRGQFLDPQSLNVFNEARFPGEEFDDLNALDNFVQVGS
jgi:hypothetical protein